jgi:lysophospholipase L1-like esterase
MLIGDSIRHGYQPLVAEKLGGKAEVYGPRDNCLHSGKCLLLLEEWVGSAVPDILVFNFGLHDSSIMPDGCAQIVLEQYRLNLERFIERAKKLGIARLIWAASTPCYRIDASAPVEQWVVNTAVIHARYRSAAHEIIGNHGIEIIDLWKVVHDAGPAICISPEDGVHMTAKGNELLAESVAETLLKYIGT